MKKILLLFMLAISVSYCDDVERDMKTIISIVTQCGQKNINKYALVIANLATSNDLTTSTRLFVNYLNENCSYEAKIVDRVIDKYAYTQQAGIAILNLILASQMLFISNILEEQYNTHMRAANRILN